MTGDGRRAIGRADTPDSQSEMPENEKLRHLAGADNAVTSRDTRILVDQAAEPVASSDADVVACGRNGRTG